MLFLHIHNAGIQFYLKYTRVWNDIPFAVALLKKEGLFSFFNRFFLYLRGVRIPRMQNFYASAVPKRIIYCTDDGILENRKANSEIPKYLQFVFGYETTVLAYGTFSLVRTLNRYTAIRYYGKTTAATRNEGKDINNLKSEHYNLAICNSIAAKSILKHLKIQNIKCLTILYDQQLNQDPGVLVPILNFVLENTAFLVVSSQQTKMKLANLGIVSDKITVISLCSDDELSMEATNIQDLYHFESFTRSMLSLLTNTPLTETTEPGKEIIALAETTQTNFRKSGDICIILHLYYLELWDEICTYLNNVPKPFDLFISINPAATLEQINMIRSRYPDCCLYVFENRGRDIAPFLMIYKAILPYNYKYACKIHTKQSPHFQDESGKTWRTETFDSLLGSNTVVSEIINHFNVNPKIGIIAPKNYLFKYKDPNQVNRSMIAFYTKKSGIPFPEKFFYPAGTMFWFRPQALQLLSDLRLSMDDFVAETVPQVATIDGSLVHALERLIPLCAMASGYSLCDTSSIKFTYL